jgi:hypothetical protein
MLSRNFFLGIFWLTFVVSMTLLVCDFGRKLGVEGFNAIERGCLLLAALSLVMGSSKLYISQLVGLGVILIITFISAVFSNYEEFSWNVYLRGTMQFVIIFMLLAAVVNDKNAIRILRFFSYIPIIVVINGIIYKALGLGEVFYTEFASGVPRLSGSLQPAFLASLCISGVYASLKLAIEKDERYWFWLVVNVLILLLTAARMALLVTFLLAASVFFLNTNISRKFKFNLVLIGIFAAMAVVPFMIQTFLTRIEMSGDNGRDVLWEYLSFLQSFYPNFGIGLGHQYLSIPDEVIMQAATVSAHNEFKRLALEIGDVQTGMVIFAFVASGLWLARHKTTNAPVEIVMALALFMVNSMVANSFSSAYVFLMLFVTKVGAQCNFQDVPQRWPAHAKSRV